MHWQWPIWRLFDVIDWLLCALVVGGEEEGREGPMGYFFFAKSTLPANQPPALSLCSSITSCGLSLGVQSIPV